MQSLNCKIGAEVVPNETLATHNHYIFYHKLSLL